MVTFELGLLLLYLEIKCVPWQYMTQLRLCLNWPLFKLSKQRLSDALSEQ